MGIEHKLALVNIEKMDSKVLVERKPEATYVVIHKGVATIHSGKSMSARSIHGTKKGPIPIPLDLFEKKFKPEKGQAMGESGMYVLARSPQPAAQIKKACDYDKIDPETGMITEAKAEAGDWIVATESGVNMVIPKNMFEQSFDVVMPVRGMENDMSSEGLVR